MARGRIIDKRVSNSKKLGKVSDKAARLYFMIYPHLDKKGRIAFDDLDDLKTEIIPYLKNWPIKKISVSLNELADIGLIQLYPNNNKIALQFERFEDFQTIRDDREAASRIEPPGETPEDSGVFRITPALRLSLMKLNEGMNKPIFFDFDKKKFLNIQDEDIQIWKDAYPKCDMKLELNKMRAWLIADPKRRKKNYKRFINNWLSRTQDSGGTKGTKGIINPNEFNDMQEKGLRG